MDDQEVSFDYKTQIDNFLTGRDPDDQSQPELLDEFPRFRNYIYVGLGNLTGNNRTIGDPGKIMLDYRLIENFSWAVVRSQEESAFVTRKGYISIGPKELFVND